MTDRFQRETGEYFVFRRAILQNVFGRTEERWCEIY